MLDRQRNKIVFECDACSAILESEKTNFEDARKEFREQGWKAVMGKERGEEWEHYCPDCATSL